MDDQFKIDGAEIRRRQVAQICRVLGYEPEDVLSIHVSADAVDVEVFVRVPFPGSERGMKILGPSGKRYMKGLVTHSIVNNTPAIQEATDER